MQAQLNFLEFFVEELTVKANSDYDSKKPITGGLFVDYDILKSEKKSLLFKIPMVIEINKNNNNSPYQIFMRLNGFFCYPEGTEENYINKTIGLNAPSILYGVARGIIAQVTANYEYGKFIIPAVNLIEILKKKKKTRNKIKKIKSK